MKLRVTYSVTARDLTEAIRRAEAQLTAFAPEIPTDEWHVTLEAKPITTTGDGTATMWEIEVLAIRSAVVGP